MLIRGALVNALAFTGSSYLFHRLSKDSIDRERKRHDAVTEQLQKAQIKWTHKRQQRIDFINKQLRLERKVETKFTELNDAMQEYHEAFGHELPPLSREPVLSDYYTQVMTALSRVGNHSAECDWNWRSLVLYRELNYIMHCNIIWLPYTCKSILQYLQPEPISFVIPNPRHLRLY